MGRVPKTVLHEAVRSILCQGSRALGMWGAFHMVIQKESSIYPKRAYKNTTYSL